jgi:hypothetical protein
MLQFTSLLFFTNAAHAYSRKYIFYALLLVLTTAASVAWHSSKKELVQGKRPTKVFWIEQAFIWGSIIMSIFYAIQIRSRIHKILLGTFALAAFALSAYLIYENKWNDEYSKEHAMLHIIACICDHCVIAGL